MISPLSLEPLLLALREAGLPVGVAEIDRLRQVFSLQPDVAGDELDQTRRRLKVWLRALLVKSPQDRATFERIYDRWLARAEQDLQFRTLPESPPAPSLPTSSRPQPPIPERDRRGWQAAAAMLVLVSILVVAWLLSAEATCSSASSTHTPPRCRTEQPPPQPPPKTPAEIRQRTFSSPVATLTVVPSPATWTGWLPLGLGGLALVAAGGLWLLPTPTFLVTGACGRAAPRGTAARVSATAAAVGSATARRPATGIPGLGYRAVHRRRAIPQARFVGDGRRHGATRRVVGDSLPAGVLSARSLAVAGRGGRRRHPRPAGRRSGSHAQGVWPGGGAGAVSRHSGVSGDRDGRRLRATGDRRAPGAGPGGGADRRANPDPPIRGRRPPGADRRAVARSVPLAAVGLCRFFRRREPPGRDFGASRAGTDRAHPTGRLSGQRSNRDGPAARPATRRPGLGGGVRAGAGFRG